MSGGYQRLELNYGHDEVEVVVDEHLNTTTITFAGRDPSTVSIRFNYKDDLAKLGKALLDAAELMD